MRFLCANFIAPVRIDCIGIIGGLAIFATLISSSASAQDRMRDDRMRDDRGRDDHRGGMGGGAIRGGVGVGLGILGTLPQESGQAKAGSTTSKTTTKKKKQAKKPDDDSKKKKQAKKPEDSPPQKVPGTPPQTPPGTPPTNAGGPPQTPPAAPPPTAGGPPETPPATPPTTAGGPPQTPVGGSPPAPPGPPSTTDNPPTTAGPPPTSPPSGGTGNTTGGGNTVGGATTPVTHRPLKGNDCPQRGKGCAALIIDYSKADPDETNFEDLSTHFIAVCGKDNVEYVAPHFVNKIPEEKDFKSHDEYIAALKARKKHNDDEQGKVDTAIANHRAKVGNGVEVAIEILNGHGSGDPEKHGRGCGSVGPETNDQNSIPRRDFHYGNYKAVYDNACTWFVADFSCYSGKTPEAADELNNSGADSCLAPVGANVCSMHAAYENDIALGTANSKEECFDWTVGATSKNIEIALDAEAQRRTDSKTPEGTPSGDLRELIKAFQEKTRFWRGWSSKYVDSGYKYCVRQPPEGYP
jgi:hypothetical protein